MKYQKYIEALNECMKNQDETHFLAKQLLIIHSEVRKRKSPVILELGVDRGQSTKVFLNAIDDKENAQLISVDIRDCSKAAHSEKWNFIQSDSTNEDEIIKKAPILKDGIDILYIDSLHTKEHVLKEISYFYKYMNKGSVIFIDDIDSFPYMKGKRKDNLYIEYNNREILSLVENIYHSNMSALDLTIYRGSTGLAQVEKRNEKGLELNSPLKNKIRNYNIVNKLIYKLFYKKSYHHSICDNSSFLLDPTRYEK